MKKLFLFIFALVVSIGNAWAQPTTVPDAPTLASNKVRTVFSATYGNAVGLAGAANTTEVVSGTTLIKAVNGVQYSIPFAPFCVSDMEYLHYDIWANEATTIAFSMYCTSTSWIGKQYELIAGWNSIDIPLSYFTSEPYNKNFSGNITELNLCKSLVNALDGFNNFTGTEEFYIANIYYYTETGERYDAPTLTATASDVTQTTLNLNLNATKSSLATTDDITYTITWNNGANSITPNPTGTSGVAKVITVEGLTAGTSYTFHVVATDNQGESAEKDVNVSTALAPGIPPTTVPSVYDSQDVIPVYGSYYADPIQNQLNAENQSQFDVDGGTKQVWKLSNYKNANIHFPDNYDAPTYDKLIFDIYSEHASTICIYLQLWHNGGAGTDKGVQFDLAENDWTHYEVNLQALLARTNVASAEGLRIYDIQFKGSLSNKVDNPAASDGFADADGSNTIYIGNVYFYKASSFIDSENPVMSSVTVTSTTHNTATLIVKATDDNTSGTLTYTVKNNSSDETVGTGSAVQNENATITITGLTPETNYTTGAFTVFATDPSGKSSTSMNVPAFTTAAAPAGQELVNGDHSVFLRPYHYTGTNIYELIITSNEVMSGTGGTYWSTTNDPSGNKALSEDKFVSADGHAISIVTTATKDPSIYTPLYILMPGEINFGYVSLTWIEIPAVQATVTNAQWASFSSTSGLDFSNVVGLTAYKATENSATSVHYEKVSTAAANTGLVLNGDNTEARTYYIPVKNNAASHSDNLLKGTANGAITISPEEAATNKFYAFGKKSGQIGFVKVGASGYTVPTGKAYLELTDALAARDISFIGLPGDNGETTSIEKLNVSQFDNNAPVYNLSGQRVGNSYKGIVIINGKKVVRK